MSAPKIDEPCWPFEADEDFIRTEELAVRVVNKMRELITRIEKLEGGNRDDTEGDSGQAQRGREAS